jgi:hypothetical protein
MVEKKKFVAVATMAKHRSGLYRYCAGAISKIADVNSKNF